MSKLNTLTRQEYKGKIYGKIYVRNIFKNDVGSETNVKSRFRIRKKSFRITTLIKTTPNLLLSKKRVYQKLDTGLCLANRFRTLALVYTYCHGPLTE